MKKMITCTFLLLLAFGQNHQALTQNYKQSHLSKIPSLRNAFQQVVHLEEQSMGIQKNREKYLNTNDLEVSEPLYKYKIWEPLNSQDSLEAQTEQLKKQKNGGAQQLRQYNKIGYDKQTNKPETSTSKKHPSQYTSLKRQSLYTLVTNNLRTQQIPQQESPNIEKQDSHSKIPASSTEQVPHKNQQPQYKDEDDDRAYCQKTYESQQRVKSSSQLQGHKQNVPTQIKSNSIKSPQVVLNIQPVYGTEYHHLSEFRAIRL